MNSSNSNDLFDGACYTETGVGGMVTTTLSLTVTHEIGDFIGPVELICTAATDGNDQVNKSLTLDLTGGYTSMH